MSDVDSLASGSDVTQEEATIQTVTKRRRVCKCGPRIPRLWSESLHNCIHADMYKLNFPYWKKVQDKIVHVMDTETAKLPSYLIICLNENDLNDSDIRKSVRMIQEFISLEMGSEELGLYKLEQRMIYLALMRHKGVIGYLEAEPAYEGYSYVKNNIDWIAVEEDSTPVDVGISKLWVLLRYRRSKIATELVDACRYTFSEQPIYRDMVAFSHLTPEGILFASAYMEGVQNINIYTTSISWYK